MKSTKLLLIFLSIILVNCTATKKEIDYVIFSGKIENSSIDSLIVYDKNHNGIKTIYLSNDNTFNDTLFISSGYYQLGDWKTTKPLFLKTKFNLNVTLKYSENEFSLFFKGIGSVENNYLKQQIEFNKKFKNVEYYKYYLSLDESNFLKLADSIKIEKINFLHAFSSVDSNFLDYESFAIEFDNARFRERYQKWRGEYLKDESFQISPNFPNPFKNIDISNENLISHPDYLNAIKSSLEYRKDNDLVRFELLPYLEAIEEKISSQKIIDDLAYSKTEFILQGNTKISDLEYSKFMSIVENENYRKEIDEFYQNSQRISYGKVSPTFEFYDINNNLIALESLKGKLVYIDIWATWCIPCIKEIPALKIIEEEFKNEDINFVSMCLKDSKENFEKMVKEKKLGGIQLFTPDPNNSFFKEYYLNTIPRFILIDREGKIIDGYASKPSDPKLKEQILEYL